MYCLLPLYALLAVAASQGVGTPVHIIVVDAGNTSSQLKIYKEALIHTRYGPDVSVKLIYSKSFAPGLSRHIGNPRGILAHLDTILAEARRQIASSYFEWTDLYVLAASGIRFLPVEDVEFILQTSRDLLHANRTLNPFRFEPNNVQLLSGEEEGALSWLAANYLIGALDKRGHQNETVGVLDIGNASTQITFIPDEPLYSEKFVLKYNKRYPLYVQSYLQYGSESIQVKIANALKNRSWTESERVNPCLLKDDVKTIRLSDGTSVTHRGSGDPVTCEEILEEIVKPSTGDECQPKPCAIGRVYQPRVSDIQFLATVGFVYAPTALGVVDESKILYLDRLRRAAHIYCKKPLAQVMSEYEKDAESASHDCLMGLYTPVLFTKGFGFSLESRAIKLAPDYEGEPIDRCLGFVLQERNEKDHP